MANTSVESQIDKIIEKTTEGLEEDPDHAESVEEQSKQDEQQEQQECDEAEADSGDEPENIENINVEVFNIALHQYLKLNEEINVLLTSLKERNKKKKELAQTLSSFLQQNKVQTVNLGGSYKGKFLENTVSYKTTGFTKRAITEAIHDELKEDDEIFTKVMSAISSRTKSVESWNIKLRSEKKPSTKIAKAKSKIEMAEELLNE
jgi:hypothetical protein